LPTLIIAEVVRLSQHSKAEYKASGSGGTLYLIVEMKNRTEEIKEYELNKFRLHQKIEEALSLKLGIHSLRAVNTTIRDERGWRVNEKQIDYCWLISVAASFVGWCWLFSIKFNPSHFRGISNKEELIQGIFTIDQNGAIGQYYEEHRHLTFRDQVRELTSFDLFDANRGITLDGVEYEYLVFAPNAQIRMTMNNPSSTNWKIWEQTVWQLGTELSEKAGSQEMKAIFKSKNEA
jgi:hypothetical protein